ncbi:MAG: VOC family protein [Actinobacteria bacterium]|nr:VOC family protein [Actinomycetota bacterium]
MPQFTEHAHGMPCWIDSVVSNSTDRLALIDFYTALFGWQFDLGTPEMGYYSIARNNGEAVLGIGEQDEGRGLWITYFTSGKIEVDCKRAADNGAQIIVPPMQIMNLGWMCLLMDPFNTVYGLWQPIEFHGFGVMYEPNSLGWFDHVSEETQPVLDFYKTVLGVGSHNEGEMKILTNGDQWFASVSYGEGSEHTPQWMPVFVVDSLDRIKGKVRELGGEIIIEEMPVPGSAISVFREPVKNAYITVMAAGSN